MSGLSWASLKLKPNAMARFSVGFSQREIFQYGHYEKYQQLLKSEMSPFDQFETGPLPPGKEEETDPQPALEMVASLYPFSPPFL